MHLVRDRRRGGDEVEVELAHEPLADDLHVEQPEEAAPEAEAERAGRLGLVGVGAVVEAELLERVAQVGELVAVDRVQPAEHHRLGLAVALERLGGRAGGVGDRLAGAGLAHVLDAGDEVAGLAGTERGDRRVVGAADADLVGVVDGAGLHEPQPAAGLERAGHHPHRRHDAAVAVVVRVEDERLQRIRRVAGGRRDVLDDGVEQLGHAVAGLGADPQDVLGRDAEHLLDLGRAAVGVGGGQVELVEAGDDLEVVLEGEVAVGEGLGLDALGGVDEQDHALAGGQGPGHLVAEVDVARACRSG